MSELQARYFWRGHKMTFANDGKFFDCEIVGPKGVLVGGVTAAVVNTTPEEFLERCKAVVERTLTFAPVRYQGGTTEKNLVEGWRK
jgi:hypothetical protein